MTATIKYMCSQCGKEHEDWPALTYTSPSNYEALTEEDKKNIAELGTDLCIIRYPDQTDRFIRGILTIPVIDHCENLEYGLWVSVSEKSFQDYSENFSREDHETSYFGWLCSDLPDYNFKDNIPTTVFTRTGSQRPNIVPHKDFEHLFVRDYYNGITKAEAERRIVALLKLVEERDKNL